MRKPLEEASTRMHTFLVFRLGDEILALATLYIKEILKMKKVHRIPHRNGKGLLGLVNSSGELEVCVSLHYLLGIEPSLRKLTEKASKHHPQMIIIEKERQAWVFPADEVFGIYSWDLAEMENVPVNLAKSSVNYIIGILKWGNACVGVLDENLLFSGIMRNLA
jgi:chemotaxis-related protein WspD